MITRYETHISKCNVGVAIALSSLAFGTATANAVAESYGARPPMPAEMGQKAYSSLVVGAWAVAEAEKDAYATENLPAILKRIGGCETRNNPKASINYRAQNPISTASGGFQYLDSTWDNYRGYKKARHAPVTVQNKKAILTLKDDGTAPWNASKHCWG